MTNDVLNQLMALAKRVTNLEMKMSKYVDKEVDNLTPYTQIQTAYIDDTEVVFTEVPTGNLSVYMQDSEGNYPDFTVERSGDRVTVGFEPLTKVTTVTISVL